MKTLRKLWKRQRGVSYPLSFVMIAPFYLMFMCFSVDAAMVLTARIGLEYAAYSAARSAVVWQSAEPKNLRETMPRVSAALAMAAYTGGRQREVNDAGPIPPEAQEWATQHGQAIIQYQQPAVGQNPHINRPYTRATTPPDAAFLERKVQSAFARTKVTVEPQGSGPHAMLKVTVRFRAPLYMPVASRFLSTTGGAPYGYDLETTVEMQRDSPKSQDGTLGIAYQSKYPR
jgi:hypothetical protein